MGSLQFDAGSTPDFSVGYRDPIQARLELPINNHANTQYFVRMIAPVRTADAKTVFMDDLLMRIVNKRLTAVVRENQSLDYSPFAMAVNSDSEHGVDWILSASVEPADAQKVENAFDEVIQSLAQSISADETAIVAKQLITDLNNMQKNASGMAWYINRYVINDFGLDAALDMEATTRSITASDLTQRAQQIFGASATKQKVLMTPQPDAI